MEFIAFYTKEEAIEYIKSMYEDFILKFTSANCSMFRCPRELDSWSGEISAIEVYSIDDDYNRIDFVGYWTTEEELKETTDGY